MELKSALHQFQLLYLGSIGVLFIVLAFFAYTIEKERLITDDIRSMNNYIFTLKEELKNHQLHYSNNVLIDTKGYMLSFYDIDHTPIISQLDIQPDWENITWNKEGILYVRHTLSTYYFGIASIVIAKKIDTMPIVMQLATLLLPLFFIMAVVGSILSRIAFKPAQKAFDTIDTFIKHITHDLKTPIAVILSNARILEDKITNHTLSRFVQRISIGAKTLTGLYDDLVYLNFQSHSDTSKPELIKELIYEQLTLLETLIDYKKLSIKIDVNETKLFINSDDFRRLLNNLLTNAIKYNMPQGSIIIILNSEYLSIKDNGIGLSKEEQHKIYERYWRGKSSEEGLGIGMEIVIHVCKIYNLTLDIESTKNQGSEFIIRWPKSLIV